MKLSAPIHVLKSQAKELKKSESIPLHEALNKIAQREGYSSWSLLQAKSEAIFPESYSEILEYLNPGDLVLLGGRPMIGKTTFSIGLFVQAIHAAKGKTYFFTLSEIHREIARRIANYDELIGQNDPRLMLDYSDDTSASYIIEKTSKDISEGSVIFVDYLQLLDHKRSNPPLQEQIDELKAFAKAQGCIIIFLTQVSRNVEYRDDKTPTPEDIKLVNPVKLECFNKIVLLHRSFNETKKVQVQFHRPRKHSFEVLWDNERQRFF